MALRLKAKIIDLETGGLPVVSLNEEFAKANDLHVMDRVLVKKGRKQIIAAIDTSERIIKPGEIGLLEDVWKAIGAKEGDEIEITPIPKPESNTFIRKKMDREELTKEEIFAIVRDIVDNKLTDVELTAFVAACYMAGLSLEETFYLTQAIVETGGRLKVKAKKVLDKHSIGGVPGNRVTMVLVPIIASAGFYIPKTSSRAITSPAGTADTMEVLANVSFNIEELQELLRKNKGFIAWGGAINLAAADDKLIRVRNPLSLDPEGMMLASILAKKIAVSSTHVILDLPLGEEAKVRYLGEARHLERMFIRVGSKFGLKIKGIVTDGSQPIGNGIGPCLEARDVLYVLRRERKAPIDLMKKSLLLSARLLELAGVKEGYRVAKRLLMSGKAYSKMKEIIEAQGGNPKVKPDDIPVGEYSVDYTAESAGVISYISNHAIAKIARAAGAPHTKEAGIFFFKKAGSKVRYGEKVFRIYAKSEAKLDSALRVIEEHRPITIEKTL